MGGRHAGERFVNHLVGSIDELFTLSSPGFWERKKFFFIAP
jgi:hypothetical protein